MRKGELLWGWLAYRASRCVNRPYFGSHLVAAQCTATRQPWMRRLLRQELQRTTGPFRLLEVGSWAGQSTLLWAGVCDEMDRGTVFCVDHWSASTDVPPWMQRAARQDRVFQLFWFNVRASGLAPRIVPIRGASERVLPVLAPHFDVVYLDADHAYSPFMSDLRHGMALTKMGGILCGDDLELAPNEVDVPHATAHREENYILDPRTGRMFHPGVNRGLVDMFGEMEIRVWDGFWAMRRTPEGYVSVGEADYGEGGGDRVSELSQGVCAA